ncbi:hypothetical protein NIES21_08020 [Anabaenopsis circularis NIES-21]|uniref:Uncharacterized protein n=1 Tax=Anabaenopsis circularis NIES-21 TaxID=1085406 RepID=A0A1Z4GCG5_9CYAN|nr:hypothetical protein NIES21_08020 [Anabaenopsis circularis NIES-21]
MTNTDQLDITARLDDINECLEQLGEELAIQNSMRWEGINNQQI